jgi:hypothetical protein
MENDPYLDLDDDEGVKTESFGDKITKLTITHEVYYISGHACIVYHNFDECVIDFERKLLTITGYNDIGIDDAPFPKSPVAKNFSADIELDSVAFYRAQINKCFMQGDGEEHQVCTDLSIEYQDGEVLKTLDKPKVNTVHWEELVRGIKVDIWNKFINYRHEVKVP